eukprot:TRINITY_DN20489_c0_g1_i1.p1 TRINITY_DN20489_c0_g1~~TRINITY_DN20489_c0_g1_i1.p1  ORF type:complete len:445 (-),score=70.08 TRINITY_DN20489_c0_g1_i1:283-1617(-)
MPFSWVAKAVVCCRLLDASAAVRLAEDVATDLETTPALQKLAQQAAQNRTRREASAAEKELRSWASPQRLAAEDGMAKLGRGEKRRGVLLAVIDGAQWEEFVKVGKPGLEDLHYKVGFTGGVQDDGTQQNTTSGPGYATLLTGHWANIHGITSNGVPHRNVCAPSLLDTLSVHDVAIYSYVVWSSIHDFFARDLQRSAKEFQTYERDKLVVESVERVLTSDADSGSNDLFVFAQFDQADKVAHTKGFGPAYDEALATASKQIGGLGSLVKERASRTGEEWLFLVTTDHGREDGGVSHGEHTQSERRWFLGSNVPLNNAAECRDGDIDSKDCPAQTDVAPTIATFLRAVKSPTANRVAPFDGIDLLGQFTEAFRVRPPRLRLDEAAVKLGQAVQASVSSTVKRYYEVCHSISKVSCLVAHDMCLRENSRKSCCDAMQYLPEPDAA